VVVPRSLSRQDEDLPYACPSRFGWMLSSGRPRVCWFGRYSVVRTHAFIPTVCSGGSDAKLCSVLPADDILVHGVSETGDFLKAGLED
jgi:hypothetical protein